MQNKNLQKLLDIFPRLFSFNGQLVTQETAEQNIRDGVNFRGTNLLILVFAIFIASLGLNTNSTAVIIGAMLISPLMGPIIGLGLGVGIHDFELIKRCLRNLFIAALFSIVTATIYFIISPVNEQHSELLARTSPTIYDVLIGFFGGAAGIIALGSTNKGNVIPGVAIATALMPPLCTAGYGLATLQMQYFLGASYLFLINSIYIAFATFIGVKVMKYKGHDEAPTVRARRVMRVVYAAAILTMLPSIYLTYRMIQNNKYNVRADEFVRSECNFPDTQVLGKQMSDVDGQRTLTLSLIGKSLPADSLYLALTSRLKYYGLEGTHLRIFQGGEAETALTRTANVYSVAQTTISRQQNTIDSLTSLLDSERYLAGASYSIAPEIKALYPEIKEIGISEIVFCSPQDSVRTDTSTIALIQINGRLSGENRERLVSYLSARLSRSNVHLVEVPVADTH